MPSRWFSFSPLVRTSIRCGSRHVADTNAWIKLTARRDSHHDSPPVQKPRTNKATSSNPMPEVASASEPSVRPAYELIHAA